MSKRLKEYDVSLSLAVQENDNLSDRYYKGCSFCQEYFSISPMNMNSCATSGKPFCPDCIRSGFHEKNTNNILQLSYRGVIGCYYYNHYKALGQMYLSEIQKMIELHTKIGLHNPLFCYDPKTFMWFIDFNPIKKDEELFKEVTLVCKSMMLAFDIKARFWDNAEHMWWDKLEKALNTFLKSKKRNGALIPTFANIIHQSKEYFEDTRNFKKNMMNLD